MYAIERFGAYANQFRRQELDTSVLHHAKRALLDWHASLFPGLQVAPVPQLRATLHDETHGADLGVRDLALLAGTAAHAAEVDDSFRQAMYHPGAATIAAALAVSRGQKITGLNLLRAVVFGYEVSTRIGMVLGREHYRYWHSTGTVGTFGAAAAAASILELNSEQCTNALATAATFAAGLQQAFRMDSMSKPLHAGRAAEAGALAAQLTRKGVTGSLDVLDGEMGLSQAMGSGQEWDHVLETLGSVHNISQLTFKNHIGCGHTFPSIDATLGIMNRYQLDPCDIEHVHVATYGPALDIACYRDPQTENEARFSVQYVVAAAILHGSVRLNAYTPQRIFAPDVRAMMPRITTTIDPELDAAFPAARGARVTIETLNGKTYSWLQSHRKGDPELPLSDSELEEKLRELAEPVIGIDRVNTLIANVWNLDRLHDVRAFVSHSLSEFGQA